MNCSGPLQITVPSPWIVRQTWLIVLVWLLAACGASEPGTFSEVLKTYPEDAKLCETEVSIEPTDQSEGLKISGNIHFQAGDSLLMTTSNLLKLIRCYGTKITVNGTVTIDGKTYESGTLLTVDRDLRWVVVSSWD